MQIILVQAEIEKAIRNYVNSKVQVNEGQDIRIDLSASRGPEGFRATIDIIDEDATAPKAAAPKVTAEVGEDQAAAKAKAVEAAEAEAKKKAEAERAAAAQAEAEAEKKALETADSSATEPPFEPDAKEEVQETAAAPAASEQPAAPRKPLFGRSNAALNA